MTARVGFEARGGGEAEGVLALPAGEAKAPAVVLLQEWWGLNAHIESLLERLAGAGFLALAPDLYHGKTTKSADEAGALMGALDWPRALDEIAGAARCALAHPRCNGKVGVLGFCMGGALTLASLTTVPELAAGVPFYGVPDATKFDYSRVTAPVCAHFATRDNWVNEAAVSALREAFAKHGKALTVHMYEADHAFVNDTRPEVYAPEAAQLAWQRSLEFLRAQLGA